MIEPFKATDGSWAEVLTPTGKRQKEILRALEIISTQIFEVADAYVKVSQIALQQMKDNCPHKDEWSKQ